MGTNYYACTLPSSGISKYFKETLNAQKYLALKDDLLTYLNASICHLGKKSIGWKFIWNPNYRIDRAEYLAGSPYIIKYMAYMFDKNSITRFILRPNIIIYDEYGDIVPKDAMLDIGFGSEPGDLDSLDECDHIDTTLQTMFEQKGLLVRFANHCFESDGLIFSTATEFS